MLRCLLDWVSGARYHASTICDIKCITQNIRDIIETLQRVGDGGRRVNHNIGDISDTIRSNKTSILLSKNKVLCKIKVLWWRVAISVTLKIGHFAVISYTVIVYFCNIGYSVTAIQLWYQIYWTVVNYGYCCDFESSEFLWYQTKLFCVISSTVAIIICDTADYYIWYDGLLWYQIQWYQRYYW